MRRSARLLTRGPMPKLGETIRHRPPVPRGFSQPTPKARHCGGGPVGDTAPSPPCHPVAAGPQPFAWVAERPREPSNIHDASHLQGCGRHGGGCGSASPPGSCRRSMAAQGTKLGPSPCPCPHPRVPILVPLSPSPCHRPRPCAIVPIPVPLSPSPCHCPRPRATVPVPLSPSPCHCPHPRAIVPVPLSPSPCPCPRPCAIVPVLVPLSPCPCPCPHVLVPILPSGTHRSHHLPSPQCRGGLMVLGAGRSRGKDPRGSRDPAPGSPKAQPQLGLMAWEREQKPFRILP